MRQPLRVMIVRAAVLVMLSRATRLDDLLLLRLPPKEFFDAGPPQYLREFLAKLNAAGGPIAETRAECQRLLEQFQFTSSPSA